ncbi:hypothetical protein TSUD_89420 [Trifolium subterraneum]|uniref:DUF547 domain-containing protein n=1 Tax=Trifolium subterraneum TaxID=3900 RepID=A0A2Z6MF88_TRISU|nr:hypothetical protein TSUD_89420 [Trifolium subterraneum]
MHDIMSHQYGLKQCKLIMDTVSVSSHKRSNSDPMKWRVMEDEFVNIRESSYHPKAELGDQKQNIESKKRQYNNMDLQSSLSQEAAKELIKEIGILELEVMYLEQYLLSLYRKRFDEHISSLSTKERRLESASYIKKSISALSCNDSILEKQRRLELATHITKGASVVNVSGAISDREISVSHSSDNISTSNLGGFQLKECINQLDPESVLDSSIHRCYSALSQQTVCSIEASSEDIRTKAAESYHSLPLFMLEQAQCAKSNSTSLAEQFENSYNDNVPETPNWLSEEMIKCISAIYCELTDSPFLCHKNASSPGYEISSKNQGSKWGSQWKKHPLFNLNSNSQKLKENEYMLRRFRSLVSRLQEINPRNMKHEEKLAFWINVHNALAMLVYGISANNVKRMSTVLKAAYDIGGHTVSVEMIQNFILGCRLPSPGQWLRQWFPSKTKPKVRDIIKGYAIHHPEPLLLFALCTGSHSDPAVRLYTSKRLMEELQSAKEEYIQSNIAITKEHKIILPKIVDSFAKSSGLGASDLVEMVKPYVPESQRNSIQEFQSKTSWKGIELTPHDFTFHYLLSKELAWCDVLEGNVSGSKHNREQSVMFEWIASNNPEVLGA